MQNKNRVSLNTLLSETLSPEWLSEVERTGIAQSENPNKDQEIEIIIRKNGKDKLNITLDEIHKLAKAMTKPTIFILGYLTSKLDIQYALEWLKTHLT